MKLNNHKKMMYDYKYNSSNNMHKEIEELKRIKAQNSLEISINERPSFFRKVFRKKKSSNNYFNKRGTYIDGKKFLGI